MPTILKDVAKTALNFMLPSLKHFFTASMIVMLITPSLLITQASSTRELQATPSSQPISAPPEPFLVHNPSPEFVLPSISALVGTVSNIIAGPSAPEGHEAVHVPSLTEKITAALATAVHLNAPAARTTSPPPAPPPGSVLFDFDGDGKADVSRWHSANSDFRVKNPTGGTFTSYTIGSATARPAPGDFDGDGKTDVAVFDSGTWTIRKSSTGTTQTVSFGSGGDIPVTGDYDGDGKADEAVFRPSTNVWWVLKSSTGTYTSTSFGSSGDIPVAGNYDSDSKTDMALFRPSDGNWYITGSTVGYFVIHWGISSDVPAPADFDGDNITDIVVFRPSTGTWYVLKSSTSFASYYYTSWGNWGDQPVPADYDGDGKADIAIWRPTTGVWWINRSSDNGLDAPILGVHGDFAIPSAYLKQVGGNVESDDLALARLSPKNATGSTDLYSQNFSWNSPLVSLPGRAGLDLNLGISYNTLIWTKVGSAIVFDPDNGNVSPGFRIGYPTIEPVYYDGTKSKYGYMMVTPSGSRVEFRQTAVTNVYETADSTYAQLVTSDANDPNAPVENLSITVTSADGTRMSYVWNEGAFRCTEIKDRNGNYLTIAYDSYGRLNTVTDTLGRVVTVNYNTDGLPGTITQTWKDTNGSGSNTTHTWATFAYTTTDSGSGHAPALNTNFGSLTVVGPPNDTVLKVLQKITYPDNSYTTFTYNNYAQVTKVQNSAADNSELNHQRLYDIETVSGTQSDCPRYNVTKSFAENFNGGNEITVTNTTTTGSSYSLPGSLTGNATKIKTEMTDEPDGLYTLSYFGDSGWKEGLPLATEDCVGTNCSDRKRWTWTDWTQDTTSVAFTVNPRVVESRVGDTSNVKRTSVEYWLQQSSNVAIYGLVKSAFVYDTDLSTVLKQSYTEYDLDTAYASRRIIGLPSMTEVYGREASGLNLISKVTYGYDEENFTVEGNQNISSVIRHDTNYSSSFVAGRGNRTTTKRWDVDHSTDDNYAVTNKTRYDIAGSVVAVLDPLNRKVAVDYTDNFNDSTNRNAYAYPKLLTDPAGNSSTIKYRFDMGANVWAKSPDLNTTTAGKESSREYDAQGRVLQETLVNNGAYTRYEYPSNGIQSRVYTTVVDINNDGADASDEVLSESWFDGTGHVRRSRTEHPGSTGGWSGTQADYDILGRVSRQSVPTEISVPNVNNPDSWTPAGDDASWRSTYRKYDWKGRVVRKINTDGTDSETLNDTDILISYAGCGCAGGQVTTIEGERVPIPGTSNYARRKQKIYEDILGRQYKTETYQWDGSSLYSTTELTFNGRDQVINSTTTDNTSTASPQTHQDTAMTFDGHGRLKTRHLPEQQNSDSTAAHTTYSYNADDTVASITDARGAATEYGYNNLSLPNLIHYTAPTGISVPDDIEFGYDALGNRTSMEDALGTVSYAYDSLSRMTSETRVFSDTLTGSPNSDSTYQIHYSYNLNRQLASLTEPFGTTFAFSFDKLGRSTGVKPTSAYGDLSANQSVVSGMQYRAFGSLKQSSFADGTQANVTYNNRLQPSTYRLTNTSNNQILFGKDYYFTTGTNNDNDGRLKRSVNYDDTETSFERTKKDRTSTFDAQGRIASSDAGEHGGFAYGDTYTNGPFQQQFGYDPFGHVRTINDRDFETYVTGCQGCPRTTAYSETITNNRTSASSSTYSSTTVSISQYEYDQDGRLKRRGDDTYLYNAAGQQTSADMTGSNPDQAFGYDGDGKTVKYTENGTLKYYLNSTVLNSKVADLTSTGALDKGYVLSPSGSQLATVHDGEVTIINGEPLGEDAFRFKMDKSNVGRDIFDPLGRGESNTGYGGGGPCAIITCNSTYNPPGGFDGLAILMGQLSQQRWEDDLFWNAATYIRAGVIVTSTPPPGWDRYHSIDSPAINIQTGIFGEPTDGEIRMAAAEARGPWHPPFVFDAFTDASVGGPAPPPSPLFYKHNLKEPCPPYPDYPSNANLDANIKSMRDSYLYTQTVGPPDSGEDYFARVTGHIANFANLVKPGGKWDYKTQSNAEHNYEEFGNFNFGATGGAAGFSLDILLRAAGYVQQHWGDKNAPGVGGSVSLTDVLSGKGGEAPFGDQASDQAAIKRGYSYYIRKFVLQVCE